MSFPLMTAFSPDALLDWAALGWLLFQPVIAWRQRRVSGAAARAAYWALFWSAAAWLLRGAAMSFKARGNTAPETFEIWAMAGVWTLACLWLLFEPGRWRRAAPSPSPEEPTVRRWALTALFRTASWTAALALLLGLLALTNPSVGRLRSPRRAILAESRAARLLRFYWQPILYELWPEPLRRRWRRNLLTAAPPIRSGAQETSYGRVDS